jgi:hypothetical protein
LFSWKINDDAWQLKNYKSFSFYYTEADKGEASEYVNLVSSGIKSVEGFFSEPYKNKFDVYICSNRKMLDSVWSKDWGMSGFKSECWMVASGVAKRVDIIAPKAWDKEACEHRYSDKLSTQQLITHELVHVYNGQLNASSNFQQYRKY